MLSFSNKNDTSFMPKTAQHPSFPRQFAAAANENTVNSTGSARSFCNMQYQRTPAVGLGYSPTQLLRSAQQPQRGLQQQPWGGQQQQWLRNLSQYQQSLQQPQWSPLQRQQGPQEPIFAHYGGSGTYRAMSGQQTSYQQPPAGMTPPMQQNDFEDQYAVPAFASGAVNPRTAAQGGHYQIPTAASYMALSTVNDVAFNNAPVSAAVDSGPSQGHPSRSPLSASELAAITAPADVSVPRQPVYIDLTLDDSADEETALSPSHDQTLQPEKQAATNLSTSSVSQETVNTAAATASRKVQERVPKRAMPCWKRKYYPWLEEQPLLPELPNAKKQKLSQCAENRREVYQQRAANSTARFFLGGNVARAESANDAVRTPLLTPSSSSSLSPPPAAPTAARKPRNSGGKKPCRNAAKEKPAASKKVGVCKKAKGMNKKGRNEREPASTPAHAPASTPAPAPAPALPPAKETTLVDHREKMIVEQEQEQDGLDEEWSKTMESWSDEEQGEREGGLEEEWSKLEERWREEEEQGVQQVVQEAADLESLFGDDEAE